MINELLRKHIDINISNKRKKTTLMSRYLIDNKIEDLLICDAIINIADFNNNNALHLTCKWQANFEIIKALLQNNIDFIIRNRRKHIIQYYMKFVNKMILSKFSK